MATLLKGEVDTTKEKKGFPDAFLIIAGHVAIVRIATYLGGIMGVAVGLLFAPQEGKRTRELIREYYGLAAGKVNEFFKKAEENNSEFISKAKKGDELNE